MTPDVNDYPRGTTEFVKATVTSGGTTLDTQVVKIALSRSDDHTWLDAHWIGDAGTTRSARTDSPVIFSDAGYPARSYGVFVKVTDDPEVPIIHVGTITIS